MSLRGQKGEAGFMKTLYLHVSTHKTGTTSFRQFLYDHHSYLTQNGIFPHIEDESPSMQPGNSLEFAHYFMRSSLNTVVRADSKAHVHSSTEFVRYVRAFRRQFMSCPSPGYLVSAETLCSCAHGPNGRSFKHWRSHLTLKSFRSSSSETIANGERAGGTNWKRSLSFARS
jgi:hypothetical protein